MGFSVKKIAALSIIISVLVISAVVYFQHFRIQLDAEGVYQGYIEGNYIYISQPFAGKIVKLHVEKGENVNSGVVLFELDAEPAEDSYRETESLYEAAVARYKDLTKGLRPEELAAIEASIEQARAVFSYSNKELERVGSLYKKKIVSQDKFDAAQSAFERDSARLAELKAKLEAAKLGARDDQVEAAKREVERTKAALDKAKWQFIQTKGFSPSRALVVDVFYAIGEFVPAGLPVISLLPPDKVRVRFFVPEPILSSVKTGQNIVVAIDGMKRNLKARISYISPSPEYTPPMIYSKDNREKMVFMVEAAFSQADAENLNPGQPVEVMLEKITPEKIEVKR